MADGGRILSADDILSDTIVDCDLVVVGTGAGGAMALRDAARAGLRVIAVEEGGHHQPKDFTQRERAMLALLFQDGACRQTRDGGVIVLQGRGVGGSTVHNTNLCKRAPERVLAEWAERCGLADWSHDKLIDDFAAVESDLHVSDIDLARVNRNNQILLDGMKALGWRGGILRHNRRGCIGSGFCELGCAYDAKENAAKLLVPDAVSHGAVVYTEARAERVIREGDRATGIIARGARAQLTIRARAVALAGSAVGSAALALASGLGERSPRVGTNLHLHPGAAVAGIFKERVEGWVGIPQSVECTEHIDWEPGSDKRTWIIPAFAHPIGLASMLPGFGAEHMRRLRQYPNVAVLVAMLHDQSAGRVTVTRKGSPQIDYTLLESDRRALVAGVVACARLLLAAGATEVIVPATRPYIVRSERDLAAVSAHNVRIADPPLTAAHPMGTLPMAADPARGVTDARGAFHGTRGLYVCDGSLFPTSLGGPPQISIYTAGRRVARAIIEDLRRA